MKTAQNPKQEPSNKSQKNLSTKTKQEELTSKEKYDNFWNKIFLLFIAISLVGLYYFIRDIGEWRKLLTSINPNYKLPGWSDLKLGLIWTAIIALIKIVTKKPLTIFCSRVMKESYRNPKNDKDRELAKRYLIKLPDHLFKMTFYIISTVFGFFVLRNIDYFPKSLGGTGYFPNIIRDGYPGCFFDKKPPHFAAYYMFTFGFFSCDSIWFFILPRQTDYINMLLHHIVTISLLLFSYFTNISHVGCVVLFLHVFSDIFVHLTRFFLQTDVHEYIKSFFGILLVVVFMYARIYVLGSVIYTLWSISDFSWHRICYFLYIFMSFLFIMHINWGIMLLQKFFKLLTGVKITDTTGYNTRNLKNENKVGEKQKKTQ